MKSKIKVVDSVMGSGKSSSIIEYIKDNPQFMFVYVTPLLTEVERVVEGTSIHYCSNTGNKLQELKDHISKNKSVAITHKLFVGIDDEIRGMLESCNKPVHLIVDETPPCFERIKISKQNISILVEKEVVMIEPVGKYYRVHAIQPIKGLSQSDQYYNIIRDKEVYTTGDNELLVSMFPADIYSIVDSATVLTYNFKGTDMDAYFKFHKLETESSSVKLIDGRYQFIPVEYATGESYRDKIRIVDNPKMNAIGKRRSKGTFPLSKNWYMSVSVHSYDLLRKNCVNFFKNISKTSSKDNMYTTFKDGDSFSHVLGSDGTRVLEENFKGKVTKSKQWCSAISDYPYKDTKDNKCFVPFNTRGTNEYSNKKACAFLVDIHYDISVVKFFKDYDIFLDSDKYALNTLIQWIWRSDIRNGGTIDLYIPSQRMRYLLMSWLGYAEDEIF